MSVAARVSPGAESFRQRMRDLAVIPCWAYTAERGWHLASVSARLIEVCDHEDPAERLVELADYDPPVSSAEHAARLLAAMPPDPRAAEHLQTLAEAVHRAVPRRGVA